MDESGSDVIYLDEAVIYADSVMVSYEQYEEQVEYSDNEILLQINENIVAGASLISALIGMIVGIECAKELLKIWLT